MRSCWTNSKPEPNTESLVWKAKPIFPTRKWKTHITQWHPLLPARTLLPYLLFALLSVDAPLSLSFSLCACKPTKLLKLAQVKSFPLFHLKILISAPWHWLTVVISLFELQSIECVCISVQKGKDSNSFSSPQAPPQILAKLISATSDETLN